MMGGYVSQLQGDILGAAQLISDAFSRGTHYKVLLQRASSDPGLPVENPTAPYWMQDPPHPELLDRQDDLPTKADVVIVGSGITGAAAARTICELCDTAEASSAPTVVVLEARQLCSGATARNGGHIKCAPHEGFARLKRQLGSDAARKIVSMQLSHLPVLREVGEQIPEGEVRTVETADLFLYEEDFCEAKRSVEALAEEMPGLDISVWEGAAAREKFGVNEHVVGVVSYEAGALWPFRLVTGVWHQLCEEFTNLRISTHTSVEAVEASGDLEHPYVVCGSRGKILTRHVLHATNGYAGHLVPTLRGRLTGVLGHMTAQRPGDRFPKKHGKASWSVMYSPGFDYASQCPDREDGTGGHLMLGGGLIRSKDGGLDQMGIWDDSRIDSFPLMHVRGSVATVFEPRWGSGSEMIMAWTGVMGYTGDLLPLVGRLPSQERGQLLVVDGPGRAGIDGTGEWIAAGFNGEGMVWAWLSGVAVGLMMLGKEEDDLEKGVGRPGGRLEDWFPMRECAVNGVGRLERADLRNAREWM